MVSGSGSVEPADEKLTASGASPKLGVAVMAAVGARLPPDGAIDGQLTRVDVQLVDVAVGPLEEFDRRAGLAVEGLLADKGRVIGAKIQDLIQPAV